jgi:DNA polymerase I-like protein with 3'-5' exonuclease and polymerase domains/5'-3' exonuclease
MVIDTSSVVWASLLHGKDQEFGRQVENDEGQKVYVNSAQYGFDNAVTFLEQKMARYGFVPCNLIFVVEGPGSKTLRTSISDTYKAGRTEKRVPAQYDEFNKTRDMFLKQFLDLGARSVTQSGLEADDIIAYLAQVLPSCLIVSTDGDLQQCISDKAHYLYKDKMDENRYGPWPTRYTTLYKALVGDPSDNIKGARGFGDKAFLDLYCMFGEEGLDEMANLIQRGELEKLHEDVPELKSLQRIIDSREHVYLSWQLAKPYPEKVNTWRAPLKWSAGLVLQATNDTPPELKQYAQKVHLVTADNYAEALDWFTRNVKTSPKVSLDIETASPPESDEWLEMKRRRATDKDDRDLGVDVLGHQLVGMGLTFGRNDQFTVYLSVRHKDTANITSEDALAFVKAIPETTPIVVHNAAFELTFLHREWGDLWPDNGWHGFLPNVVDNRILATYIDEERRHGLKSLSKDYLGYEQVSYQDVTQGRKMNEMTAAEVLDYGTDDTICTAALFNHFKVISEIEGTWDTFLNVEQYPAYLTALAFNQGTNISLEKLVELEREDQQAFDKAQAVLREYLISKGWDGTTCPQVGVKEDLTPAFIKEAHLICTGEELKTQVRTPSKLVALCAAGGQEMFAKCLSSAVLDGDLEPLNRLIKLHFKGEPQFNIDSSPQVVRLLYEVMKLEPRLFNPVTDTQRKEGRERGNPRGDDTAMQWALQNDVKPGSPEEVALKALQAMKIANTRRKMFYEPYRTVQHWKDNKVHALVTQNGTNTRRYTSSGPNLQQLPKHPKATGEPAKFRQVFVPHHGNAVIVSMDFEAQELRVIADYSHDENMLACFVGEDKKDMHALTATGILKKKAMANRLQQLWTLCGFEGNYTEPFALQVEQWREIDYAGFHQLEQSEFKPLYKTLRAAGKKTNFTTEYGAQAPKLAETLLIDQDEAQQYIDAKLAAFPQAEAWKKSVIAEFHKTGYSTTKLGARRHLGQALFDNNAYDVLRAERQAVNFKIQGSSAEMTKLAMARFWEGDLCYRYDAVFIGPIHDEVVFSVGVSDLIPFLQQAHEMMTEPYADMFVPIGSSISIGRNFGEQVEVGNTVDPERIKAALMEIFLEPMRKAA